MANKECLVIVLDVRKSCREDFKLKSIKCAAEILKDKICAAKKDYVSFVLVGTENTDNDINRDVDHEGYLNIVQYPHVQLPTWQLLINFFKFVNEPASCEGDWLDALVVAMGLIKSAQEIFRVQRHRIVLFQDFSVAPSNGFEMFDQITKSLLDSEVNLIVIASDIAYIDHPDNKTETQAVFQHNAAYSQTQQQFDNEKYAYRLVSHCNANLCNFEEAQRNIFKVTNKRPWTWNSTLNIGTSLTIAVSGVIAIKNENSIKLKKCWAECDEEVTREKQFIVRGEKVQPLENELIEGYMLGGTPVLYDKELHEQEPKLSPGLKFVGFTKANSIPSEYFCGDKLYWVVHQRGMNASAKKLEALVKAMHNTEMAMVCWKVFSQKFCNPRLVVLLPNKVSELFNHLAGKFKSLRRYNNTGVL